jgi:hypothetical protein
MEARELYMNAEEELLKRYVEAVIIPRVNTDNIKYPIRDSRINHLFLKEYTKEFWDDLNELKKNGYSHEDVGKLFRNPSRLMRMGHLLLKGAKLDEFSIEEQRNLIVELLKIVEKEKSGNIFNENKRNIILDSDELSKLIDGLSFTKTDRENARLIQRLCGMLWAYSESPFFVAHDIGMEEHGLYDYKGKNIMIRDFFNLRPTELWSECEKFPFNEIRIICTYSKDFQIDFDIFSNTYPNKGNVIEDLEEFYIEADGKSLEIDEIDGILESSSRIMESISKKIETMSMVDIAKKYADVYWYRKRPLRDALNKSWAPGEHIYELIDKGEVKPDRKGKITADDIRKEMGLI